VVYSPEVLNLSSRRSLPENNPLDSSIVLENKREKMSQLSYTGNPLTRSSHEGLSNTERTTVNNLARGLVEPKDLTGLTNFYLSKQAVILEKIKNRQAELGIAAEDTHKEVRDSVIGTKESCVSGAQNEGGVNGKDLSELKAHLQALKA
jgi:hypothetical protein